MKLKNKTKQILKNNNKIKEYNNLFALKQTRFLLTRIIGSININADPNECANLEMKLTENRPDMFIDGAKQIPKISNKLAYEAADWESLGKFLYYVFQTGVFYKNKKANVTNIYTKENYNKLNIEKKMLFNQFVESIKIIDPRHNILIKNILKVVL